MPKVRLFRATDGRKFALIVRVSVVYFCLEALSAQKGKKIAAIAELDVLGADGKPIHVKSGEYAMPTAKRHVAVTVREIKCSTFRNPLTG